MVGYTAPSKNSLTIGGSPSGISNLNFQGDLDEISIWKTASSEEKIHKIMYTKISNNEPDDLFFYLPLDEGQGRFIKDYHNRPGYVAGNLVWGSAKLGKPLYVDLDYRKKIWENS